MVISIFGILLLFVLLGLLVLLAGLLAYPHTRPFGLALLGVFGVVGLLLFGWVFSYRTVVHVPATENVVRVFDDSYSSTFVPAIELEQASKDMAATAPVAEVVERLNNAGDDGAGDSVSKENEGAAAEPPVAETEKASDLPAWVTVMPSTVEGVFRQVVDSGPWSDLVGCQKQLNQEIRMAVEDRVRSIASDQLRRPVSGIPMLEYLGISETWIQQNVLCSTPKPFVRTTNSSVGPMKTLYVQLEIDRNDQEFLRQKYIDYIRRDRIAVVTTGGVFVLGGIGLLFGLLKVDTWTKGYYTKRLFLGVPAAIIGVVTLLALMMS